MSRHWSHPTWNFLHTFAEKVSVDFYNKNVDICIKIVKEICNILPCPVCRYHATLYMKNISIRNYRDKESFKKMLYDFHNAVNIRLRKPKYPYILLDNYKGMNIISIMDVMCTRIREMNKTTMFETSLNKTDLSVLNNIQTSIHKYQRYFL